MIRWLQRREHWSPAEVFVAVNDRVRILLFCGWAAFAVAGCGTYKSRSATEQLLLSDAVDRSIASIDFGALAGRRVFFDTDYIKQTKGVGFVNAEYVISSLRQQMMGAGVLLADEIEDSDCIVEARIGALGIDGHEVVYGLPASNALSNAAAALPNSPPIPALPEIAVAKKHDERGAAKIGVFAYDRQTREPIWQSGISLATSNAKDAWVLGAGPWQYGTVRQSNRVESIRRPLAEGQWSRNNRYIETVSYFDEANFERLGELDRRREAKQAAADQALQQLTAVPDLLPLSQAVLSSQPLPGSETQPTDLPPPPTSQLPPLPRADMFPLASPAPRLPAAKPATQRLPPPRAKPSSSADSEANADPTDSVR